MKDVAVPVKRALQHLSSSYYVELINSKKIPIVFTILWPRMHLAFTPREFTASLKEFPNQASIRQGILIC